MKRDATQAHDPLGIASYLSTLNSNLGFLSQPPSPLNLINPNPSSSQWFCLILSGLVLFVGEDCPFGAMFQHSSISSPFLMVFGPW